MASTNLKRWLISCLAASIFLFGCALLSGQEGSVAPEQEGSGGQEVASATPIGPDQEPTSPPSSGASCPTPTEADARVLPLEPDSDFIDWFESEVGNYLNARGGSDGLESELETLTLELGDSTWQSKATVQRADINGDQVPEVVLDLVFYDPGQYAEGVVLVYRCAAGSYETMATRYIGGAVQATADPDPGGILGIGDLNGDGISDLVLTTIEVVGTHGNYTRVIDALSWDGTEFASLVEVDEYGSNSIHAPNSEGELVDLEGDGVIELVVTVGIGWGPEADPAERPHKEVWSWTGSSLAKTSEEELARPMGCVEIDEEVVFRFQAILFGDIATLCGDDEAALEYYQQAVFDEDLVGWSQGRRMDASYEQTPTPDPEERARINAYGRYRILLLHVARGLDSSAEVVYDGLIERFPAGAPGSQYAALAEVFWSAYQDLGEIEAACQQASVYASENADQILRPLGSEYYGSEGWAYDAADVCPFGE